MDAAAQSRTARGDGNGDGSPPSWTSAAERNGAQQLIAGPPLAGVAAEALVEEVAARVGGARGSSGASAEPDEEEQLADLAGAAEL